MKDKSVGDGMVIRLTDENWGRGPTGGSLCRDGRYCILGHAMRQLGLKPTDKGMPSPGEEDILKQAGLTDLVALMDVNDMSFDEFDEDEDDDVLADAGRVERFNELLAGTGWEVVFEQGSEQ